MKQKIFILFICGLCNLTASAQEQSVRFYGDFGTHSLYGFNAGLSGFYSREMSSRLTLTGGLNFSSRRPTFFNALQADATLRFPIKKYNLYLSNRLLFSNYSDAKISDLMYRIAATWESRYFDFTLGNAFIYTFSSQSSFFEYIIPSFGMVARLRPRENWWNTGLFIRNYDDFIYENYNINFGLHGNICIKETNWTLFSEMVVGPAGTLSQLSTPYKFYIKIGATYKW